MENNVLSAVSSIASALLGGLTVTFFNFFANKKRNKAEVEKLIAETEKIRVETSRISTNLSEINGIQSIQEDQIKEIQRFLVSHLLTNHERNHLKKLNENTAWQFVKDHTTKYFFDELRNLRSLGLIEGHPNKGIRSLDREGGDVNSHFKITQEGIRYIKIFDSTNNN